ncbi:GNAT family N-acetyltransferase [Candidatus Synechococcus calcipolaris G9]|uniref:GNAT family N-acetyltransferase n=1 Tax=Candidatus Synechococcus calcipolaris G9 TaxID=1497997 RepID=A0ABT6F144_9SYNE|nr:GNAT family N-acetyltransferase [Candidatus Synechococcus calcipolaris]MDG2991572.1 GNAT family N-acetyltransferase [Candidatus Synechococcus calcipolaris G9]
MQIYLAPLQEGDIGAAIALDQRCLGGFWGEASYRQELSQPHHTLLGIHGQGMDHLPQERELLALGASWGILEETHITLLMVHPDYRRRGLGQCLLWGLLKDAQQRGDRQWATLEVRASNQGALHLYQGFGFTSVGTRPRYYDHPVEDAVILWCKGLGTASFRQGLATKKKAIIARFHRWGWQFHS